MTTFILHGGATSKNSPTNDLFFDEFTKLVDKPKVHILLCYLARKPDEWEKLRTKDTAKICKNTHKQVTFHVVKNSDDLLTSIDQSDVLYVAGGDATLLEPNYHKLMPLKNKLHKKVYAGSSMGAFLASQAYVLSFESQDAKAVHTGIDLLPIQTLCHWNIENKKQTKLALLMESNPSLPIFTLNECQFITLYL